MSIYYSDDQITLHLGDALKVAQSLPSSSVDCIVTSPPYFGLRDYGTEGQYGLEKSPAEYYVADLSNSDCRFQLIQALYKLALIRMGPQSAPVGAVLELADHAVGGGASA